MTVINYDEEQSYKIKQLLDIAGFKTVTDIHGVTLIDKLNPNADKYAELRFRNLREAVNVINPYLMRINYKVIA